MVINRFLKTVLSMLCIFALLIGSVFTVSADIDDVMFDLKSLGVLEDVEVNNDIKAYITRAEFSQLVVNLLGYHDVADTFKDLGVFTDISESKYSGAINLLYDLNIISGTGVNTFSPKQYLTYPQVGKFMVNILGYSNIVKSTDLYAYSMLAGSLGVYDDVDSSKQYVTWADALVIAHNALDVDIMTKDFSMIGDNYRIDEGKTLRTSLSTTKGKNVEKLKGIVTADYNTYLLEARSNIKPNQVEVNGKIYNCNFDVPAGLVGMEVNFYIDYSGDGDGIVTSIAPTNKNTVTKIYLDKIDRATSDEVKYLVSDDKTETLEANGAVKVVYNDRWERNMELASIEKCENGYVRLIDNDDDDVVDIVFVYEFTDAIVDRIYAETKQVFFANNQLIDGTRYVSFDEEEDNIIANIINAEGNEISFEDIKENNIISIAKSRDGQVVNAVVTDKMVTGVVNEIDDYSVVIGTDVYDYVKRLDVKIGTHVDAYVNFMNKVFYVEKTKAENTYAYVMDAQQTGGLKGTVKVSLIMPGYISEESMESFDEEGSSDTSKELYFRNKSKVIYELASKVRVTGISDEVDGTKKPLEAIKLIEEKIVSYSLDADNRINKIEILDVFNGELAKKYYNENGKTFSSKGTIEGFGITESATMSICIPSNADASDDDLLVPVKLVHGTDYAINAYDVDETSSIAGLVVINSVMQSGVSGSISRAKSDIAAMKKVSRIIDEDGNEVLRVQMITKDGEKNYVVSPLMSTAVQNRFISMDKGDLFFYEKIAGTDELCNCELLMSVDGYEDFGVDGLGTQKESCVGTVSDCRYNYVSALKNRWTNCVTVDCGGGQETSYEIFKTGTPVIFIIDDAGNAKLGSFDDIQCGNTIYIASVYSTVRAVVVRK